MSIQDYLIAAIQNITILISKVTGNSTETKAQRLISRQRLLGLIQKIIPKYFGDNFFSSSMPPHENHKSHFVQGNSPSMADPFILS